MPEQVQVQVEEPIDESKLEVVDERARRLKLPWSERSGIVGRVELIHHAVEPSAEMVC